MKNLSKISNGVNKKLLLVLVILLILAAVVLVFGSKVLRKSGPDQAKPPTMSFNVKA